MLYYTPPSDKVFEEVKTQALSIWLGYEEPYRTEKVNRIKDLENISDNVVYMVAMFDILNQHKLANLLSPEARMAIRLRLIAGGQDDDYNPF